MNQTLNQSQIVEIIITTINKLFNNIFSSINNSMFSKLDDFAFIDIKILDNKYIKSFIGDFSGGGKIIYLTDALLIAIALYFIIKYFFSAFSGVQTERPFQFIFKLFVFALIINFSYTICFCIINFNNLISSSLQELGKDVVHSNISFAELINKLNNKISISASENFDLFSFDGMIKTLASIGLLSLLLNYSVRYVLIMFFIISSPLAFLSLINYSTNWIFKAWFKSLFSLLVIQIFLPLIFIVIFSIDMNNKILFVGSIYTMTKINDYVRELFGGISSDFSHNLQSQFLRR